MQLGIASEEDIQRWPLKEKRDVEKVERWIMVRRAMEILPLRTLLRLCAKSLISQFKNLFKVFSATKQ